MKYLLALDAGTTSNRAMIFRKDSTLVAMAQKEFRQYFPQPGWVEQDPMEIWSTQLGVAVEAMAKGKVRPEEVAAIGITNQRETTILWDKTTGRPVYNAIVWQCRRTADYCDDLRKKGYAPGILEKTGLVLDPYFSATKIRWILDHSQEARELLQKGNLLFGTVDTWLLWNLTDRKVHATDVTNASRTMLFNIHRMEWDEDLLELFGIPKEILPEVRPTSSLFGYGDSRFFGKPIPIGALVGDQQAALFGQGCFHPGDAKNTYGTGAFLLMNLGEKPVLSKEGLITTVAWKLAEKVTYALEGSVFVAGSAIQWLRDELGFFESSKDSEAMALSVSDTAGCYVVPAFTGLGAPYWDPHARGAILGITRGVNKNHIVRGTLESIAHLSADVLEAMERDGNVNLRQLKADGGAGNNNFLLQFQADLLNIPVIRPGQTETTALGAAYFAGLAVGLYGNTDEIEELWQVDRVFAPKMEEEIRKENRRGWLEAVKVVQKNKI